jgi:subtilisin-like proprotein convertase family protein
MRQHLAMGKSPLALIRAVTAALVVALLLSGLGPGVLETAARDRNVSAKEVQQFSNTTRLFFGDDAPAETSSINVSGFDTPVADVDVTLVDLFFGTASSQDMDILLVGPGGQTAIILSDVGGNTATNDVNLTLDDQAANHLPNTSALTSGTFQPTNFGTGDTFQLSGGGNLTPSSGSALGVFNGSDPNGTWQLFVFDDTGNGNTGSLIQGWRMKITSANGVPTAAPDSFEAQAGKTLTVNASGVLENDTDPDGDVLHAILAGKPQKGDLDLLDNGGFTYKSDKKAKGTDSFTYLAQDPSGLNSLATVSIQIKGKKHKKHHK